MKIQLLDQSQTQHDLSKLVVLAQAVFDDIDHDYISWRVDSMPDLTTFVAVEGEKWLAFKCGYAMTKRRYYSWLGGVHPDLRRSGLAAELMRAQHEYLRSTPFEVVETHVRQDNKAMVRTNQKFGFKVAGRFMKSGAVNLILQRPIN